MTIHALPTMNKEQLNHLQHRTSTVLTPNGELIPKERHQRYSEKQAASMRRLILATFNIDDNPTPPAAA